MAQKKQSPTLMSDLQGAGIMTIMAAADSGKVFTKNNMIDYSYPTGIALIDYALGYEIIVKDNGTEIKRRKCLGLQAGSFNVITGATQSFKTTICLQIVANIATANGGNVYHYDAENRQVLQRVKTLTKLPDDWFDGDNPRYALRQGAIGYDSLQSDITNIWKAKMQQKDLLMRDTGQVDDHNRPIYMMPPTIVFLDSLSDVIAKEYDIEDKKSIENIDQLRTDTYGMRSAKTLRGVLTDVLPMLKEANIIFITIAHKGSNVAMNAFAGPKKQFQYGSHDEKMSGGKVVEYSASFVGNFTAEIREDSRYHIASDGFEGNTVLFEPIKVSTNESGNEKTGLGFRLVIDKRKEGVDNIRSLILFLNQRGRLKGNKAGFRVIDKVGEPISEKFTWKTVYEDFSKSPVTYKTFMIAAREELETLISKAYDTNPNQDQINVFDVDSIIDNIE